MRGRLAVLTLWHFSSQGNVQVLFKRRLGNLLAPAAKILDIKDVRLLHIANAERTGKRAHYQRRL